MTRPSTPGPLDFLKGDPAPVAPGAAAPEDPADRLPQATVNRLMAIPGVDGVWVERVPGGQRVVVLHYTPKGTTAHLPRQVDGMPTRIVGGEPIRAGL